MAVVIGPDVESNGIILHLDASNFRSYNPNIIQYGQTFDTGYWNNNSVTFLSTTELAPDKTNTASTIQDNSTSSYQLINKSFTVPADTQTYCLSLFVKKTSGGTAPGFAVNTSLTGGTAVSSNQRLNTDTGAVSSASVVSEGDYWRMYWTITNNSSNTSLGMNIYPAARVPGGVTDTTTATGSATIWGAMITKGSTLYSYFPNFGTDYNTWYDISGSTRNNTLSNGTYYTNRSIYFDGVDDYASFNRVTFNDFEPFTIEVVVRLENGTTVDGADRRIVLGDTSAGCAFGFQSRSTSTNTTGAVSIWNTLNTGPNVTCDRYENDIFCVTVTRDSSNAFKGYIDGIQTADTTFSGIVQFNELGRRSGGFRHYFGNIYSVKIYNRSLSSAEVWQNFEALRGRYSI